MTVREVFELARDTRMAVRAISARVDEMRDGIGVQGHGYDVHDKTGILDPMRKVDELLDWESDMLSTAMQAAEEAESEARSVLVGVRLLGNEDMALTLELVYLSGLTFAEACARLVQEPKVVTMMCDQTFSWCDSVGLARLKEAAA